MRQIMVAVIAAAALLVALTVSAGSALGSIGHCHATGAGSVCAGGSGQPGGGGATTTVSTNGTSFTAFQGGDRLGEGARCVLSTGVCVGHTG